MSGRVTVAICTHNRATHLARCLKGLTECSARSARVPVVVVNNNSTDETDEVCREAGNDLSLTLLHESRTGLSHARNAALAACETEYVVYLDDDGIPKPIWLSAIIAGVEKWNPDIFGGPYTPFYESPKPAWFDDAYGSAHLGDPEGLVAMPYCFSGGNMGWRTKLLREIGGFDPNLGMAGDSLRLGEETAIQVALWSRPELRRVMLPEMHMKHLVSDEKMSLSYLWRRSFTYGRQLAVIDPTNAVNVRAGVLKSATAMRFGMPLVWRFLVRDRAKYPCWRTFVGNYFSLHAIHCGATWAKLASRRRS